MLKVGYTALASRAAVIVLSIISNAVLPDHTPAEEVFSWTESPTLVSDFRSLQKNLSGLASNVRKISN